METLRGIVLFLNNPYFLKALFMQLLLVSYYEKGQKVHFKILRQAQMRAG